MRCSISVNKAKTRKGSDSTGRVIRCQPFDTRRAGQRYACGKPWRMAYDAASVRLAQSVLVRMLRTCVATVLRLMNRASAMSRLLLPAAIRQTGVHAGSQ